MDTDKCLNHIRKAIIDNQKLSYMTTRTVDFYNTLENQLEELIMVLQELAKE